MRKLLVFLILLGAIVFVVVPYLILPTVLGNLVARDVQNQLNLAERPDVTLDSDPQWEMLAGQFSSGRVVVGETDLGGVLAESVTVDLDPFDVDVRDSIQNGTLISSEPVAGDARLEVSEGEVLRLAQENAGMPVNDVRLRRDGVTVDSEASALGTTFPVSVRGDVGASGGVLVFEPRSVEAAGVAVPAYLADSLLAGTGFRYPVEDLPYGGTVTGARTVEGAVVLTGKMPGIELGAGG